MTYLLDTHTFVWFVLNDPSLSSKAGTTIRDPLSKLAISPASFWELAIKISTGKFKLAKPFADFMAEHIAANEIEILPIEIRHADLVSRMPYHHRDPFDRILAAQSLVEAFPIISTDRIFDAYGATRVW